MKICGPKYALCGLILSTWGIFQLVSHFFNLIILNVLKNFKINNCASCIKKLQKRYILYILYIQILFLLVYLNFIIWGKQISYLLFIISLLVIIGFIE